MTASRGIGKGNNSGGRNPGAGRPKGAVHKKARELVAKAEQEGLLLPIDYLLGVMRDPNAEPRDRMSAAGMAAPYCHARLTALQVLPDPRTMDDTMLLLQVGRLEQRLAEMPESERADSVTDQLERVLDGIPQLPHKRQEAVLRQLLKAGEAGLQRLNDPDRPGAVVRRPMPAAGAPAHPPDRAEVSTYRPPAFAAPRASEPTPAASDPPSLRYNPVTRKLEQV